MAWNITKRRYFGSNALKLYLRWLSNLSFPPFIFSLFPLSLVPIFSITLSVPLYLPCLFPPFLSLVTPLPLSLKYSTCEKCLTQTAFFVHLFQFICHGSSSVASAEFTFPEKSVKVEETKAFEYSLSYDVTDIFKPLPCQVFIN